MRTSNGGRAAVGTALCPYSTTKEERAYILDREARLKEQRRGMPRRKKPEHEKPGPLTWVQF